MAKTLDRLEGEVAVLATEVAGLREETERFAAEVAETKASALAVLEATKALVAAFEERS